MKLKTFDFPKNNLSYVRLFASVQVLIGHYFKFYEKLTQNPITPMNWFGGMVILFSISGFLAIPSIEKCNGDAFRYLRKKASRILPSYYMCCLLNAVVILLIYPVLPSIKDIAIWIIATATTIHITPPYLKAYATGSSNGSLWSIFVILQFYIVISFIYPYLKKLNKLKFAIIIFICVLVNMACSFVQFTMCNSVLYNLLSRSIIPYLYMFLIGSYLYTFRQDILNTLSKLWYVPFIFYIGYCVYYQTHLRLPGFYADPISGIMVCLLAIIMGYIPMLGSHHFKNDISYEMFLYHFPVMNVLIHIGLKPCFSTFALMIIITIIVSYITKFILLKMTRGLHSTT